MDQVKPKPILADCPYCRGTGTDAMAWDNRCERCNGKGRMARFLAEAILARWAVSGPADGAGDEGDEGDDDPGSTLPFKRRRPAA
jgi:DnaJ-class molecular chaperone